ncbi:hypothetical protein BH11CYA1_BH11CYA1_00440 [soil metagenome]
MSEQAALLQGDLQSKGQQEIKESPGAELARQTWSLPKLETLGKIGDQMKEAGITFDKNETKLKFDLESKHDTWLQVGALSYHSNRDGNYNEKNYGIGLLRRLDDESAFAVGYYKNSIHRDTFYATYHYTPYEIGPVKLGLQVGLVTGYKALGGGPVPLLLPLATIEGKRTAVDLTCIPAFGGASSVCAAQFRFKFD